MRWGMRAAAVLAAAAGGVAVRRALRSPGPGRLGMAGMSRQGEPRWHAVTINRPVEEVVRDGQPPAPITELGDLVEVRTRAAPGGRGTELALRLRDGVPSGISGVAARVKGDDPVQAVRKALREAKQLVETGEILSPDRPGTSRSTPLNRPLEMVTGHGREEGRL